MPCCFSVLLPSFFAQNFRSKTRRIAMTGVFSLGIATIMLPIAFGVLEVAQTISASHRIVFVVGGFLMILFGLWTLWGRGMLPQLRLPVNLTKSDIPSVYALGVFSGAATSCCAPVLAGVLVLTAVSPSLLDGMLVGFTYVFGMVFPLLVIAVAWDKYRVTGNSPFRGRMVYLTLFDREFSIHSSKLIAAVMFLSMGVLTAVLGVEGAMLPTPGVELVNSLMATLQASILSFSSNAWTAGVAMVVTGTLILGGAFVLRNRLRSPKDCNISKS